MQCDILDFMEVQYVATVSKDASKSLSEWSSIHGREYRVDYQHKNVGWANQKLFDLSATEARSSLRGSRISRKGRSEDETLAHSTS
jgi:hypothetical protein